jgi:hypothetical protein
MTDRAALAAMIEEAITPRTRGYPDFYPEAFTAAADVILAAGWARCRHKDNRSGFRNGAGPWQMTCGDCGHQWTESTPDWRSTDAR